MTDLTASKLAIWTYTVCLLRLFGPAAMTKGHRSTKGGASERDGNWKEESKSFFSPSLFRIQDDGRENLRSEREEKRGWTELYAQSSLLMYVCPLLPVTHAHSGVPHGHMAQGRCILTLFSALCALPWSTGIGGVAYGGYGVEAK